MSCSFLASTGHWVLWVGSFFIGVLRLMNVNLKGCCPGILFSKLIFRMLRQVKLILQSKRKIFDLLSMVYQLAV